MFKLDDSLGYLVNRAATVMRWALEARLAKHGLTPPQWAILARLWEEDALPMSEVGAILNIDKPTTSGIVDRLERKELVRRARDSADRRVVRICLTEKGRRLQGRLPKLAEEVNAVATRGMTARELAALKRALSRVWHNFD